MIKSKKELEFYIMADYMMNRGYFKPSLKQRIKNFLFPDYIMQYIISMRKVAYYQQNGGGKFLLAINKIRYSRLGVKLGFSIGPNVFDYGLVIPHYGTIVVGPSNRIGKYAVLHTSVCITNAMKEIGEGLYCSAGCKLIFEGKLGSGITVGANCVVAKDFMKDNILLTSVPAVIKSERSIWYATDNKYAERIKLIEQLRQRMNI